MARRSKTASAALPADPPAPPQLMSLQEAAEALALSYWACRALVLKGHLPAIRLPAARDSRGQDHRRIMVSVADLEHFIAECREQRVVRPVSNPEAKEAWKARKAKAKKLDAASV